VLDPRQYTRELQQYLNDLRQIQTTLGPKDPISQEIAGIERQIQGLINAPGIAGDPKAVEKLAQQIIEPFKGIEMELSKALQILLGKENIRSAQEDEIPAGYAKVLEEYYRKLSNPTTTTSPQKP
jgi:hypothetical protein